MTEFFNVLPPENALDLLLENTTYRPDTEIVQTEEALGRVTHTAIYAPHDLPTFRRSTMDGYALKAADTFGASESLPAVFEVVGEVEMGAQSSFDLQPGQAVIIHTGGMVPPQADAVVQVEDTSKMEPGPGSESSFEIEVFRSVAVGQNVLQIGEDVAEGSQILPAAHRLRPQDIGGLLSLGITQVKVSEQPKVAIIATGDEIVKPVRSLEIGQVRDINSYTIAALIEQNGALPLKLGIIPDNFEQLLEQATSAIIEYDMLVISAGSSVSVRDMTVNVIKRLGHPGVLAHGVATRPGKPTVLGAAAGKPILGLPGNPVSAMVQFIVLGIPAIYRLQGMTLLPERRTVWAELERNVPSEAGREDYIPVKLNKTEEGLRADPVFGKSNLIYTLVNADGLLKVPMDRTGLRLGDAAEVLLF